MKKLYEKITEAGAKNKSIALCTIVSTKGSTPRKTGAKMIVYENGSIFGTIGGGEFEKEVIKNSLEQLNRNESRLFRHDLLHHHNMCCGGSIDVFIEPIMKKNKLYIFGAGHTGQSLSKKAIEFDFEVMLIDERKEYLEECKTEEVNRMNLSHQKALQLLPFDEHTYICIMTYSHPIDRDILSYCIKKEYAYLGMIGSKRKVEITKKMFREGLNVSEDDLNKIDMPMGVDIGAEGPDEIALSILARLIAVKNRTSIWKKELQL